MDAKRVAEILYEISVLLELKGENPFKVRAYDNAARAIEGVTADLKELIEQKKLQEIKGIGSGIAEKIAELVKTGHLKYYQDLKKEFPSGVLEMLRIQGLGPKKVKALYEKLKVKNVPELEKACQENRLLHLEGFGEKTERNILEGIKYLKKTQDKFLYNVARDEGKKIYDPLKKRKEVLQIELAGSLRRHKEVIRDIDILVSTNHAAPLMKWFTGLKEVRQVLAHGETKSSVILKSGIQVDLRTVTDKEFPFALHYFTGSKEHNTEMRSRAKKMNLKLNEYGLFKGNKLLSCKDEAEIFGRLKLDFIPPELRENMGEIEAAEEGKLPELVREIDIQGIFHVHSTYSDGVGSLEEMIKGALARGYRYVGISDHSKGAYYANGMKEADIRRQHKEIERLQKKYKEITIFKGSEVDILPDGSLDYSDSILSSLDFVIASVHSKFNMTEKDMTQRVITAMKNKYVTILGHPTGRLLLGREGYLINMQDIILAAADLGVVVELNASPHRFDLDWRLCQWAKDKKVKISINPDAHNVPALDDTQYGVGIARKGWLSAKDVLNALSVKKIQEQLQARR